MHKTVAWQSTWPFVLTMITGSFIRRRRHLTISSRKRQNSLRIWPPLGCRNDERWRPGKKFLLRNILETIFHKIWINTLKNLKIFPNVFRSFWYLQPCASCLEVVIWKLWEIKSKTLVQHLANLTKWEIKTPYDGSQGTSPLIQGKLMIGNPTSSCYT